MRISGFTRLGPKPALCDLACVFCTYNIKNIWYVRWKRQGEKGQLWTMSKTGKDDSQQQGEPKGLNFIEKMRRISMDTEAQIFLGKPLAHQL